MITCRNHTGYSSRPKSRAVRFIVPLCRYVLSPVLTLVLLMTLAGRIIVGKENRW